MRKPVERKEWTEQVALYPIETVPGGDGLPIAERRRSEPVAGVEIAFAVYGQHFACTAPVMVPFDGFAYRFGKKGAGILSVKPLCDNAVCKFDELFLEKKIITLLPNIFENHVDTDVLDPDTVQMEHAFGDKWYIIARNRDLGAAVWKLTEPDRNIFCRICIGAFSRRVDPVHIMFFRRSIDSYADA